MGRGHPRRVGISERRLLVSSLLAGLPLQDALFWWIVMLAGGLNLLVMAAVVFAVVAGRQTRD